MDETTRLTTSNRALMMLLAASAVLFFVRLDGTGLWAPDEPRFAQVAEELRSGDRGATDLVVLRLAGEPYTQKPPLYYWMAAAFGSASGHVGEIAARLPSALAALASIWLTFQLALRLTQNPTVAIMSAAILLTVFRFGHLGRRAGLDVMLTGFILIAMIALFRFRFGQRDRGPWFYALHLSLGLAVLTKGPVGLLPIPAFALFLFWEGRLRDFRNVFPWWSALLSAGPALLWIGGAVALTPAGFFDEAVVDNLLGRFFSGTAHVRPWTYYFVHFPLEFLPWTLLWPLAALHTTRLARQSPDGELRSGVRLLLVWIGFCFVFFTISAGKRGLYLLPTYPAVAVLCGIALEAWTRERKRLPRTSWALVFALAAGMGALGGLTLLRGGLSLAAYPGFTLPVSVGAGLLAICLATLAAGAVAVSRETPVRQQLLVPLAAAYLLECLVFTLAYPAFDSEKSPAPISRDAAALTAPHAPIGVFDHTAMVGGVAYYSGHPVVNLREPESLDAFFAGGGRNIIVKASKLERVPGAEQFEVLGSRRSGSRKLLIVAPRAPAEPPPRS